MPATHSLSTRAIHVGQSPDPIYGDVVPPLHTATTFVMEQTGIAKAGYDYGRSGNPTRSAFEETFASLEEGEAAFAFPSGLSAEDTLLRVLSQSGDSVAYGHDVYGGTYRLLTEVLPAEGRKTVGLNLADLDEVAEVLTDQRPVALWVETPSNPLLEVYDLASLAELAHGVGALLVVDNTFASPVLQRPLALGADIVTHSTTKYIGGHSDVIGGVVVVAKGVRLPRKREGWTGTGLVRNEVGYLQNAVGATPSPRDVQLLSRGLKTLEVRILRQSQSALAIARHLEKRSAVRAVHYPGLETDPGFELARRQMRHPGGVLSFEVADETRAKNLGENTALFALAVSLGAVESLIEHPASMTHGTKSGSATEIPANLVRISVGLEAVSDLIDDLERAFAAG